MCRAATCCFATPAALQAALGPGGPATVRLCPDTTFPGTFTLGRPVTVVGAGEASTILDGGGIGRVVTVQSGVTAELRALRITNGAAASPGGGINNSGDLRLVSSTVASNEATFGGGIFNFNGVVLLVSSVVASNEAGQHGGGIYNHSGTVTLEGTSNVTDNDAGVGGIGTGGGIFNEVGGTVKFFDGSSVTGNFPDQCDPEAACPPAP